MSRDPSEEAFTAAGPIRDVPPFDMSGCSEVRVAGSPALDQKIEIGNQGSDRLLPVIGVKITTRELIQQICVAPSEIRDAGNVGVANNPHCPIHACFWIFCACGAS